MAELIQAAYPWTKQPLIASAPMLGAATPALAAAVTRQGGVGFLAGGTNAQNLDKSLTETARLLKNSSISTHDGMLPIGVGFQNWSCTLEFALDAVIKLRPAIVWMYAPKDVTEFRDWAEAIRRWTGGRTEIWIQVGTVEEALETMKLARPDVLVVQGHDAGGHGLKRSAGIISLLPEVHDALESAGFRNVPLLAAGGIVDARGTAAALVLGASGVVMGTRFLAAEEAGIAPGWQGEILRTTDGGPTTINSTLCDRLKETKGWPEQYDGRAVRNRGHVDEDAGMAEAENVRLYKKEVPGDGEWGVEGRMVVYAGTGVGMIREVKGAGDIVEEVRSGAKRVVERLGNVTSASKL
ncbi:inosine monophosphate dehydrogenase [Teratosphaeria nubilosa]|uniref:Inosine monophosphate dehydrogenase n=1 Tax=Teratosphaeria nubilosa TaxID=161662 RepID=A0A6G1L5E6_9PEZI|nr:inosine monophosphate dehydrogenase [Teratosphaeria nubilosa]